MYLGKVSSRHLQHPQLWRQSMWHVMRLGNMSTWPDGRDWPSNQCSLVLIAENNFSEFHQFDVSFSNVNKTYCYPSVLNWAIGNNSCHEAQKRGDYACGSNSRCVNSKKGSGYTCQCNSGYRGNPTFQMAVEVYFFTLGLIFGCIVALALWCDFLF